MKRAGLPLAVTLAVLVAPLAAEAQPGGGEVARVGVLLALDVSPLLEIFRETRRKLGWVDGQNLALEYRRAEG